MRYPHVNVVSNFSTCGVDQDRTIGGHCPRHASFVNALATKKGLSTLNLIKVFCCLARQMQRKKNQLTRTKTEVLK